MKLNILFAIAIGFFTLGCSPEQPGPQEKGEPVAATGGWVAQMMDTPEYANACAETPGCGISQESAAIETESVWRVLVIREASGDVRIDRVEIIDVIAGDGVPLGALSGNHALVGLDENGEVVDGQLIRFPGFRRVEHAEGLAVSQVDLAGREVDALGYLRVSSSIVRLAVQDIEGKVIHSTEVLPRPESASRHGWLEILGVSSVWALTRPFQGLPPTCSHVIVLQGELDRHLATGLMFESSVTLAKPGPYQLAATQAALSRMTPLLCQSIARIAFGYVPGRDSMLGAVKSEGAGDMMLINIASALSEEALESMLNRRLSLQRTVTHEAAHSAETLLTAEGSEPGNYIGSWGFPARTLANKTIDRVRLEVGLPAEWQRLHKSFVAQDWAAEHGSFPKEDDSPPNGLKKDIVEGGFMSQYGSSNWAEDIATFVEYTYLSRTVAEAYQAHGVSDDLREDLGCLEMRPYDQKNLPSDFVAVYAKLHFIQDLGLVRPEDVKYCTGDNLGLPIDGEGFHVWQGGMKLRSFQNQIKASIGTKENGVRVFEMGGAGEAGFADKTYPAKVKLRLDLGGRFDEFKKVSWPRGVYPLGLTGDNNFTLRLDGAKAGNFDAMDGFVVVVESSNKRIAGSIVLQRVFRLQAPLPVPEKYEPPLVIRFLIDK